MAKWYGDDLRRKLLQAYDGGKERWRKLAQRFTVSVPWAWKISAQRKRSGQMERVEQRRGGGRKGHRRGGAAVARVGTGPAGSNPGGVTAEAGEGSASAGEHRTAVADAAADGSAAKKKVAPLGRSVRSKYSATLCSRVSLGTFIPRSRSLARPMRSYRRCRGCAGRSDGTAGPVPSSAGCCSIGSSPAAGRPLTR